MTPDRIHRRHAVAGAAALGLAGPVLAACGSDSSGSPSGSGSGALAATSDVPVGGGTVFKDDRVVVTQPTEGEFRGFTAVCTHQGCLVGKVEGDQIMCPCHGSAFSAQDGSVVTGPATEPLAEVQLSVEGGEISLA